MATNCKTMASSAPPPTDLCAQVRDSCRTWMDGPGQAHVRLHAPALQAVAERIAQRSAGVQWDDEGWHYQPPVAWPTAIRHERIALYILALDAINFCFWPSTTGYEYADLACSLAGLASADHTGQSQQLDNGLPSSDYALSPAKLQEMTVVDMTALLGRHHKDAKVPPDMEQRCTLWNELGRVLVQDFKGSALQLLQAAEGSAVKLVHLLYTHFQGFRDIVVSSSPPRPTLFFLKRAQICAGDLQASLGLKDWQDMHHLTTFADYRLPQLLRHWKVLEYATPALREAVDECQVLAIGSEAEISIRAATVVAVEELVQLLRTIHQSSSKAWTAVQVDWYLWQVGEQMDAAQELAPHHRVRTIYY
jgi:hypothetical protein